jgi:hypothetical protein
MEFTEFLPDPDEFIPCVSERATIAQQRADIAALVRYIESCDPYATVQPIIARYQAESEALRVAVVGEASDVIA